MAERERGAQARVAEHEHEGPVDRVRHAPGGVGHEGDLGSPVVAHQEPALREGHEFRGRFAGHTHQGTHILDTHSDRALDEVWDLYARAWKRTGATATLFEW